MADGRKGKRFAQRRGDAERGAEGVVECLKELSGTVVDAGYHIRYDLGPGMFESVYEAVLAAELERRGLKVERQKPIDIHYRGLVIEGAFRADLVIEDKLVVELESVERLNGAHAKQLLTYLRLMNLSVGLLLNFGEETFKQGIRRLVNNHQP